MLTLDPPLKSDYPIPLSFFRSFRYCYFLVVPRFKIVLFFFILPPGVFPVVANSIIGSVSLPVSSFGFWFMQPEGRQKQKVKTFSISLALSFNLCHTYFAIDRLSGFRSRLVVGKPKSMSVSQTVPSLKSHFFPFFILGTVALWLIREWQGHLIYYPDSTD